MMKRIYLDNNSTTELDPLVKKAIIEELDREYGNPSSIHAFGRETRNTITKARRSIAAFLGIEPSELYFTSSGTESVNSLLHGVFVKKPNGHLITSLSEHACVYGCAKALEERGVRVSYLSPGLAGAPTPEQVQNALKPDTSLIAVMAANNETGVKSDIEGIASLAEMAGVPLFVDAVALIGKELFTIPKGVTALSFSGHKFHAPKGIAGLFVRPQLQLEPLILGGPQEYNRRAGTENILGIVGLEAAIQVLKKEMPTASEKMRTFRDYFESVIIKNIPDVIIHGKGPRVVNTSNISFLGVDGESLLMNLDLAGLAVSHGSACSSGSLEPSRILESMGVAPEVAKTSIRFSVSRFTTEEEIERAIEIVTDVVQKMRAILGT